MHSDKAMQLPSMLAQCIPPLALPLAPPLALPLAPPLALPIALPCPSPCPSFGTLATGGTNPTVYLPFLLERP